MSDTKYSWDDLGAKCEKCGTPANAVSIHPNRLDDLLDYEVMANTLVAFEHAIHAVRAVHQRRGTIDAGPKDERFYCAECRQPWPCATIGAVMNAGAP